jgi:uncharacterized coiled-coil protein SlyX
VAAANEPIHASLQHITSLLEQQNRTISAQTERIEQLTSEVDTLTTRLADARSSAAAQSADHDQDAEGAATRERQKDERIQYLERELERIRSVTN